MRGFPLIFSFTGIYFGNSWTIDGRSRNPSLKLINFLAGQDFIPGSFVPGALNVPSGSFDAPATGPDPLNFDPNEDLANSLVEVRGKMYHNVLLVKISRPMKSQNGSILLIGQINH